MILKRIIVTLSMLCLFLIAGCDPNSYHRIYNSADHNVMQVKGQIDYNKGVYSGTKPPVVTDTGMYVNQTPITSQRSYAWANRPVSVHGSDLPLSFYMTQLTRGTNIVVSYQPGLNQRPPLSLDYSGTLQGALRQLAAKTGYSFELQDGAIVWSDMVSKTFDISFMPGSSQYLVGGQGSSSANATNSNAVYFGDLGNTENQYSNLHGDLSIWTDLKIALNELKSEDGKINVSQATTTVTVYDHPRNVQMMSAYVNKLNSRLSHQVALYVKVLEIDLKDEFNFGIDWNVVHEAFNGLHIGLKGNLSQPVNMIPLGVNPAPALSGFTLNADAGSWRGTSFLINALEQQGKVSVVTEPRVVTMNNQMAEIGINSLQGYLAQVSSTITGGTGQFNTESLTPGVIKTGFSLYILPKIKGKNIFLQISSQMSSLQNLTTVTGQQVNSGSQVPVSQIQLPTIDTKNFNQRSMVVSGDTLIIAGFKQLRNEANNAKTFHIPSAMGAKKNNTETILLITPVVIS